MNSVCHLWGDRKFTFFGSRAMLVRMIMRLKVLKPGTKHRMMPPHRDPPLNHTKQEIIRIIREIITLKSTIKLSCQTCFILDGYDIGWLIGWLV